MWNNVLAQKEKAQFVLGVRTAVFLPFHNLGLVIVDEEHDLSYKQAEGQGGYQVRDVALMLAHLHGAKTLLGSATPSAESYYNTQIGKYGIVRLTERFADTQPPPSGADRSEGENPEKRDTRSLLRYPTSGNGTNSFRREAGDSLAKPTRVCALFAVRTL